MDVKIERPKGVKGVKPKYHDFDLHEQQYSPADQPTTLEAMERKAISEAIYQHQGNMSEVARQLGITRQTLYNKLRKYGM